MIWSFIAHLLKIIFTNACIAEWEIPLTDVGVCHFSH